jgi:RNA polymerase sigma-70 factor (ECF subfamily)
MTADADITSRPGWWSGAAEPDWSAVYKDQLPRIYNYFRYRFGAGADAEDLTARTFEKAWRARRRYRRDLAGFATWLLRIARHVAIDHLRAARAHAPLDAALDAHAPGGPEQEQAEHSDSSRLAALLAQLPERERELLSLKYGAGVSNREIARVTGLSESNVGTILHRTVQTLRERW